MALVKYLEVKYFQQENQSLSFKRWNFNEIVVFQYDTNHL